MHQQKSYSFLKYKQKGSILIIVLFLLLIISLMIIATSRSTNINKIISNTDQDRKYAFTLAESALNIAEKNFLEDIKTNLIFPSLSEYDQERYKIIFTELLEEQYPNHQLFTGTGDIKIPWPKYFRNNCLYHKGSTTIKGLCAPAVIIDSTQFGDINGTPAWERDNVFFNKTKDIKSLNSKELNNLANDSAQNPRYIVEFMGTLYQERSILLRFTVVAWGKNINNYVMLQSYVEVDMD